MSRHRPDPDAPNVRQDIKLVTSDYNNSVFFWTLYHRPIITPILASMLRICLVTLGLRGMTVDKGEGCDIINLYPFKEHTTLYNCEQK